LKKSAKYIIAAVFTYILITLFPAVSLAHAFIVKSSPSENEILKNPPKEITIQFDESIQPRFNSIKVTDSNGNRVDRKNGGIDSKNPAVLKTGLKRNLANGTYRIQWKVVSDDGHPVQGVIPFEIGSDKDQAGQPLKTETKNYMPKTDLVIIRWLQYIGNAIYTGLLFLYLMVAPKELISTTEKTISKLMWSGFLLLCLSVMLSLPLQATIVLGAKWTEVFSFDSFEQILAYTQFGKIWLIQMALLFTLALTTHMWRMADSTKRILSWTCFILSIGLLLTRSFNSHAATQENNFLPLSFDFLHLLAASLWVGSLVGLAVLSPLLKKEDTRRYYFKAVRTFSRWGILLVIVLAATGLLNSFEYIPTVFSLVNTDYGKALLGKVILFVFMLILAAINLLKGKREKGMFSSIWLELTAGLMILFITVFLTNFPTAISSPGPFTETKTITHGNKISLQVTPNVMGENESKITLKNKKNEPIQNIEQVTLTFTHTEMDMGKETVTLIKTGPGTYKLKGMNYSMSGKWRVHVHALTKGLESLDTDFRILVGSR
jgi:copper transport protein